MTGDVIVSQSRFPQILKLCQFVNSLSAMQLSAGGHLVSESFGWPGHGGPAGGVKERAD